MAMRKFCRRYLAASLTDDTSRILKYPETRMTTLSNGLRVATESNPDSRTATVGVWIDAGSRFETEETNGVAHFVEHMVFKGTSKRSVRVLEEEIAKIGINGGNFNSYTSREYTAYYAQVIDRDVPNAIDILSDMLQNSTFEEALIDHERHVILDEKVGAQTKEVVFDGLHAAAFQCTPLGRTILGPAENIQKITRKDIQDYISTQYATHRMVISAYGAVKHEDVVEQVRKLFTKLVANHITTTQLVEKEPAIFTGSEIRMRDDDSPLAHFAVAFNGASWTDPDLIALMVMQAMLRSWNKTATGREHTGSQLAKLKGINELAESMMAFNTNYKDTGLFGIYAVAKPDCLKDLAYEMMLTIGKLCYRIKDDDVIRAQSQLKSSLLLHIDGTGPTAEDIGRQFITYGRRISSAELVSRIDAVNAATIKRVANRFVFDQDIAVAACGPVKQLPDQKWFRRYTYMRY